MKMATSSQNFHFGIFITFLFYVCDRLHDLKRLAVQIQNLSMLLSPLMRLYHIYIKSFFNPLLNRLFLDHDIIFYFQITKKTFEKN